MEELIVSFIEKWGYAGIFFLVMLENIIPVVPSEIILPFSGFLAGTTHMTFWSIWLTSTLATFVGITVLYAIGRFFHEEKLMTFIRKYGEKIHISEKDLRRAIAFFEKHGAIAVFFGRFIPVIRCIITLPAGMTKMNYPLFITLSMIASLVWNTLLIYLGAKLGDNWQVVVNGFHQYSVVFYCIFAILALFILYWYIRRLKKTT